MSGHQVPGHQVPKKGRPTRCWCQEYPANIQILREVLDLVELTISAGYMDQSAMRKQSADLKFRLSAGHMNEPGMHSVQTKAPIWSFNSSAWRSWWRLWMPNKGRSDTLLSVRERKQARWSCGLGHRAWINSIANAVLVRVWCHDPLLCQVRWFKF